jgi:hypothetical protein
MRWVEQPADRYLGAIATSAGRRFRYRSRVGELLGRPAVDGALPRSPRRLQPELLYRAGAVLLAGASDGAGAGPGPGTPSAGSVAAGPSGGAVRPPRPAGGLIRDLGVPRADPQGAGSGRPGAGVSAGTGPGPSTEPAPASRAPWTAVGAPSGRTTADARDQHATGRRLGAKGAAGAPGPVTREAGPRRPAPITARPSARLTGAGEMDPAADASLAAPSADARPTAHGRLAAPAGPHPVAHSKLAVAADTPPAPLAADTGPATQARRAPSGNDARSADPARLAPAAGPVDPAPDARLATRAPGDSVPGRARLAADALIRRLPSRTDDTAPATSADPSGPAVTGRSARAQAVPLAARGPVPAFDSPAVPRAASPRTRPAPDPPAAPAMPRRPPPSITAPAPHTATSPPAPADPAGPLPRPRRTTPPSPLVRVSGRVPTRTVQWWGQSQLRRVGLRGPR